MEGSDDPGALVWNEQWPVFARGSNAVP